MVEKSLQPIKGAVQLVKKIKLKGLAMAVASSGHRRLVEFALKNFRLLQDFEVIVCAEDIKNSKPDPEIFLKTISKIGFLPEKCVVIEDSLAGIEAAKKAGAKVIALTTTLPQYELFGYDMVINNFDELEIEHLKILTGTEK